VERVPPAEVPTRKWHGEGPRVVQLAATAGAWSEFFSCLGVPAPKSEIVVYDRRADDLVVEG
jgi:hypothetical protein